MFDEFSFRQFVVFIIVCFAEDLSGDVRRLSVWIWFVARFVDGLEQKRAEQCDQ